MINNICETNKSSHTHVALKVASTIVDNEVKAVDETDNAARRNGLVQATYGNSIWYDNIIDGTSKTSTKTSYVNSNNNNTANIVSRNVWSPKRVDILKGQQHQQKQQQLQHTPNNRHANNNECDIIIVDMENDDNEEEQEMHSGKTPPVYESNSNAQHIANDGNINIIKTDMIYKRDVNGIKLVVGDNDDDDDDDSLASMETLSDNVSIWIDGEKHWVAGVDANTTCADLIWALLNYQNEEHQNQNLQEQQHMFATTTHSTNKENIPATVINKTNSSRHEQQRYNLPNQQKQQPKQYDGPDIELNLRMSTIQGDNINLCTDNKPNTQNNINTITSDNINATNINSSITDITINQPIPINTKENFKTIPNSIPVVSAKIPFISPSSSSVQCALSFRMPPTQLPLSLPPGITTVSQLATEYVIVKQYHHCEEYLDGSTKVFDVLPPRNGLHKKECELLLRYLGPAPAVYINNTTPQLSSLISTDKDSGMGSPVGSARSAKFRRRKHKSSQWLAQANTLHPKLSYCAANERLMKIILAQDETIQRQLSLLREKQRQITKIEDEKHRKRERELGKNYLLETYLNGLDEAECKPEIRDDEEIFIDEPYKGKALTTTTPATTPMTTATPTTGVALADGIMTTSDKIPSAAEAFNVMVKHKLKEREVKKEKKKKRHKEKLIKDEGLHTAKDLNKKTNKSKDKEKAGQQQQKPYYELSENTTDTAEGEQEIEKKISWLEKIYTLNKQLQKEEELAAKLRAKVRKHQLRKAQQTQHEIQMEIEKLDNNLALQCGDIRKVEANLMQTNEQLQKKLLILEGLSIEYLKEQDNIADGQQDNIKEIQRVEELPNEKQGNHLKSDTNNILTNLEKSLDIKKLSLNNIKSKEEVKKLEKIIAKPGIGDLNTANVDHQESQQVENISMATAAATNNQNHNNFINKRCSLPAFNTEHDQRFSIEYSNHLNELKAQSMGGTLNSINCNVAVAATIDNQQKTHMQTQLVTPLTTGLEAATAVAIVTNTSSVGTSVGPTVAASATKMEAVEPTSGMCIDKNMLSSLHVQNVKTIKKQMFHTQTMAHKIPVSTTALSSVAAVSTPPLLTNAFPKHQFQHIIEQYMPSTTSTILTSRPQNSHQISSPPTNIALVQHPSSSIMVATSLSSALIASAPPTPSSPSPSIIAMNTVDISQLGTLV